MFLRFFLPPMTLDRKRKISTSSISQNIAALRRRWPSDHGKAVDYELDRFTGMTTFHGLFRLYKGGSWYSKLFWATVVAISFGAFIIQTLFLLNSLIYEKRTLSKVRFIVPQKQGIRFPSVTVCNYNPARYSYIKELNATGDFSQEVLEYMFVSYAQVEDLYERYKERRLRSLHDEYINYKKLHPDFQIDHFFMRSGFRCQDMFLRCSFGGTSFSCCKFAKPILTDIGKCFQFHRFSVLEKHNFQLISGSFYGLQFILNIQLHEYPPLFMENSFEKGIRFFVHTQGIIPFLSSGGYSVSPPFRLHAGIVPAHHQLLPSDQRGGECQQPNTNTNDIYTAGNCEAFCVARKFNETCQCTPLRFKLHPDYSICTPLQLYKCVDNKKLAVENEEFWFKRCDCPIECDKWSYNLETSYASLPNIGARNFFKKEFHMEEHEVVQNVVILDIYMKEIAHMEYEQVPATGFVETLSNIGGNMGMFIGASLITLAEITVFLVKLCWVSGSKNRRKNVFRKVTSQPVLELGFDGYSRVGSRMFQQNYTTPILRQIWTQHDSTEDDEVFKPSVEDYDVFKPSPLKSDSDSPSSPTSTLTPSRKVQFTLADDDDSTVDDDRSQTLEEEQNQINDEKVMPISVM